MTVTRTVTIDDLTPVEMALIFAAWSGAQQAEFFESLGIAVAAWGALDWQIQASDICGKLGPAGEKLIADLADAYIASITS